MNIKNGFLLQPTLSRRRLIILSLLASCLPAFFTSVAASTSAAEDSQNPGRSLPSVKLPPDIKSLLLDKKWADAAEKLTKTYESTASDPNLKYYIAFCFEQLATSAFEKREFRTAIEFLEKAVSYVDDDPDLFAGLGFCHFQLSQYLEAEGSFKSALNLNPKHLPALKKLGEIFYLTNDMDQALLYWEEALKLDPRDKSLNKRLASLKKLLDLGQNFDTEIDRFFSVSFDGEQNLQLRGTVLDSLSDIYLKIGQELNLYPNRQIRVVLLPNREFFDITGSPEWAGGVYEGQIQIPVGNYQPETLKIVLCHEYIHAVIYDRLADRCPWWLNEGLAQFFSGDEAGNPQKLQLAALFLSQGKVPSLMALPGDWQHNKKQVATAYALALSGVHFFMEKFSPFDLQAVLDLMAEGKSLDTALAEVTAYSLKEFETEWRSATAAY